MAANSVKLNLQKKRGDRLRRNLRFWAEGGCGGSADEKAAELAI
jgi:hypothetical protein